VNVTPPEKSLDEKRTSPEKSLDKKRFYIISGKSLDNLWTKKGLCIISGKSLDKKRLYDIPVKFQKK
jgi:hypothetical protein